MNTSPVRAALRPYEEVIIASILEDATSQDAVMITIHRLSQERSQLQADLARAPWGHREAARRIREITTALENCWVEVRCSRAARRVRMEEALGVDPAACQETEDPASPAAADSAARSQKSKRGHHPLPLAS